MKTILVLVLFILFCSAQNLQAQVYLFESTHGAGPRDAQGKQVFRPSDLKFQFNVDKLTLTLIDGSTNKVLGEEGIEKDVHITETPKHTEYIFSNGPWSFIFVTDNKDSDTEDELQFIEFADEVLHMKGNFKMVDQKKN
ncbi:hypothetical protein ACX3PU_02915 [Chryseobacterium sp. A301]